MSIRPFQSTLVTLPAAAAAPAQANPRSAKMAGKVPVQSLARAFSILEVLAERPTGVSLADLSRLVGLHKATVFRLVRTMVLLGYVVQTAEGEPYRVGEQFIGRKGREPGAPMVKAPT